MRHEPKAGGLLAYPIAVACVTFIGATMHLASLILELEASTSGLVRQIPLMSGMVYSRAASSVCDRRSRGLEGL